MSTLVLTVVAASGLVAGGAAFAQTTPAPTPQHPIDPKPEGTGQNCSYSGTRSNGKTTGSSTCPQPADASASQRFPYPGETTAAPATDAPQIASPSTQQPSASKKFPYPGENSKSAPADSPLKDAGSSGSTSRDDEAGSSSSSSSAGNMGDPAADAPDAPKGDAPDNLPAPKRARKKLPPVAKQTPDEREEEDVKVAQFYQNDGNYRAAYMRAKDAIGLDDTDPMAHFILAESARKLGKLDEAKQQYQRCLELDPLPKEKRESQKALKEMTGS